MALGIVAVWLPWSRQHTYLRDFYDYGLVMAGVGRVEAGERPYVDFVTPIQSATFVFNAWAERLGGGGFQGMTRGCLAGAIAALVLMAATLSVRWPAAAAIAVSTAVVLGSLGQHTILWHNGLGVVFLGLAAWLAALQPVPARERRALEVLLGLVLFASGITKLNTHLAALAVTAGWALRVGWVEGVPMRAVAWRLAGIGAAGVVLPVGAELAWTGATLAQWWDQVVGLSGGARAMNLLHLFEVRSYLRPIHDYYGELRLPPIGLIGLVLTAITWLFGLARGAKRGDGRERICLTGACALAAATGLALLATNHEIAYVALAGWFALLAAIWLGFGLPREGWVLRGGVVLPALGLAVLFGESAWRGQRSQFGHAGTPREDYLPAEKAGPEFAYLQGTKLPPQFIEVLVNGRRWRETLTEAQRERVYYGPGLEVLDRIWPVARPSYQPLWFHHGTTYRKPQTDRLSRDLLPGGRYDYVLVPFAYDHWPETLGATLEGGYVADRIGPLWRRYDRQSLASVASRPFAYFRAFGGNVNPQLFRTDLEPLTAGEGRLFLGLTRGEGTLHFTWPSYRLHGEVVVARLTDEPADHEVTVRFKAVARMAGDQILPRWSAEVILPAGEREITREFLIEGLGHPLEMRVAFAETSVTRVAAGYRALRLNHAGDGPELPVSFSPDAAPVEPLGEEALRALLPGSWRPARAFTRGGRLTPNGFELPPHGELWFWSEGVVRAFHGEVSLAEDTPVPADPFVRSVAYKGGRVEIATQEGLDATRRRVPFRTWSPEPGSWLVLIAGTHYDAPPLRVRYTEVEAD